MMLTDYIYIVYTHICHIKTETIHVLIYLTIVLIKRQ